MRRWGRKLAPASEYPLDLALGNTSVDCDISSKSLPSKPAFAVVEDRSTNGAGMCSSGYSGGSKRSSGDIRVVLFGRRPDVTSPAPAVATGSVPIVPRRSLSFADEVAKGRKQSTHPPLQSSPATEAAARAAAATEKAAACGLSRHVSEIATLVWIRPFDLRIHDNPALTHAAERRCPVHVVFAWSDAEDALQGHWRVGGTAAAFWLHHALASLDSSLRQKYGLNICFRTASTVAVAIEQAALESGSDEVVTSKAYDPAGVAAEKAAQRSLSDIGVRLRTFQSLLLHDIEEVRVDMGVYRGHFGTLTPFHHACSSRKAPPRPLPEPRALTIPKAAGILSSLGLDSLGLARMPLRPNGSVVDWGSPILAEWDISEAAALAKVKDFFRPGGGFSRYEKHRNLADGSSLSRISPYLRFGMLSCRTLHYEVLAAGGRNVSVTFWRRLTWRDLAYWQLLHFPKMQDEPIRAHYAGQEWSRDAEALSRWQRGQTGFPLVDAGMRELWATGWMAQNVRMAAAVLLCELLNIHWVEGEKWFHHTLVDADVAINSMMWQNAGKSGLDQWNFTVNPATAGRGQDPTGEYTRRWCPELAKLPVKYIHTPWQAPEHVLQAAGVSLGPGGNYRDRMVLDTSVAAKKSGDAIRAQRSRSLNWNDSGGYDLIALPRGSTVGHDGQRFRVFTKREYRIIGNGGGQHVGDDWGGSRRRQRRNENSGSGWTSGDSDQEPADGANGSARRPGSAQHQIGRSVDRRWGDNSGSGSGKAVSSFQSVMDEYVQKARGA
eukprot:TRINITY_DN55929_c0_g1_i1.p1 TRINITY_DN55929_c0_g1~~TRINITY_DN55929_c0_g1_i1.p1  ORF type:complete len:776 (-),score=112.48 TRINITY_DN55929_c0_g1_i1:168-2495(-)